MRSAAVARMTGIDTLQLIAAFGSKGSLSVERGASAIDAFRIPVDRGAALDLKRRLRTVRWADSVAYNWTYGTEPDLLQSFVRYWEDDYNWPARAAELNGLPHFRTSIDRFGLHFLHFRSKRRGARPLLLMNGWPSSFVEYLRLAPQLADGEPAFHVVMPSLPGFTGALKPCRSPGRGVALPLRDTRAPITT